MYRLHNKAFEILRAEIGICSKGDKKANQKQQIVIKRLEQLQLKAGKRATLNELRNAVVDVFPIFNETVLKEAAKVNRKPSIFRKFKYLGIALVSAAGIVTILNLPYPNIRWSVARTAPILLVPSYMKMNFHYWGAKNSVQKAERLLKSADSLTEIKQIEQKTQEAEQHLHSIPVWFLGYYPEVYCARFRCSWDYSFNEFQKVRSQTTKVETKLFVQKNAFVSLVESEQVYNAAKQRLNIAKTQKQQELAIASIETAIKSIEQIPPETLAGNKADTTLKVYKLYYNKIAQNKKPLSGDF